MPSHLLIFAPASAWSSLHITCLSPTSLSALLHMCRGAGYKKLIEWGLPSHLLIFAPASAWSLLHITCLSPSSLSALLHMCRDAGYKKLIEWGLPSHLLIFAPAADFCTCFSLVITPQHVCLQPLCLHCYTCAVAQGTKSLLSGDCQVIC